MAKLTELKGSIFLTVKELQLLTGYAHYESARREHQAIRDAHQPGKRRLMVAEYCQYEGISYLEVVERLNKYR